MKGLEYLKHPQEGFPLLDYITGCNITTPYPELEEGIEPGSGESGEGLKGDSHGRALTHKNSHLHEAAPPPPPPLLSLLKQPPSEITVLLIPSPVDPPGRLDRLKAAATSWVKPLRDVAGMKVRVLPAKKEEEDEKEDKGKDKKEEEEEEKEKAAQSGKEVVYEGFEDEEILNIGESSSQGDNADRLIAAYKQIYLEGADWLYAINDHTFLIPEVRRERDRKTHYFYMHMSNICSLCVPICLCFASQLLHILTKIYIYIYIHIHIYHLLNCRICAVTWTVNPLRICCGWVISCKKTEERAHSCRGPQDTVTSGRRCYTFDSFFSCTP
jgi:hypothetical protein